MLAVRALAVRSPTLIVNCYPWSRSKRILLLAPISYYMYRTSFYEHGSLDEIRSYSHYFVSFRMQGPLNPKVVKCRAKAKARASVTGQPHPLDSLTCRQWLGWVEWKRRTEGLMNYRFSFLMYVHSEKCAVCSLSQLCTIRSLFKTTMGNHKTFHPFLILSPTPPLSRPWSVVCW